jgi:hypothetical protein
MLGQTKTYIPGEADGAGRYRWCPGRPWVSCGWMVLLLDCSFYLLLFSIWNGERRAEREQGGLEGLTGVDVLSPGSPGVVDGYRMIKGVESTSSWRSSGRSV